MKRILTLALIVPLFVSANNLSILDFPVKEQAQHEMDLLVACCEYNASCCVDFSKSTNLEDFKNKVKVISNYQSNMDRERILRAKEIANRTMKIKAKLIKSQMRYEQRFNLIGNEDYRRR